ncbi:hypothetical protein [Amycolatopsis sp. BJA-103]|uniref:hypothetical protein n=1 Tax=Amycolatopsis sp. BJA-103 TaxID=1911175 RepID=UPI000C75A74D|nr:hypothetical protein [Amycolatopsis sp. BJA-103]AUI62461.1 hypothetical protein BKN51_32755 [Amycolatopsis sp. BJA-103]PNE18297.1 hypothetical protein B1H26_10435 [Amycolatopsis sp. BJA-103]
MSWLLGSWISVGLLLITTLGTLALLRTLLARLPEIAKDKDVKARIRPFRGIDLELTSSKKSPERPDEPA